MKSDLDPVYADFSVITIPTGRQLVPVRKHPPAIIENEIEAASETSQSPFTGLIDDIDVRRLSPRQAANLAMDLYIGAMLSWDEYSMLAFQPELHPDYDATIGALIGETADPDRPRDFIDIWDKRLIFERKYNGHDKRLIGMTERIVHTLRQIENPTDMEA